MNTWLLMGAGRVLTQAPPWALALAGSNTQTYSSSFAYAVAADTSGNVFVIGGFIGQVAFGSTVLTNAGNNTDLFVAKYVPSTGTWAWAVQGGVNALKN